jgi:hypothetical protein
MTAPTDLVQVSWGHDRLAWARLYLFEAFMAIMASWANHGIGLDECIVLIVSESIISPNGASNLLLDARPRDIG